MEMASLFNMEALAKELKTKLSYDEFIKVDKQNKLYYIGKMLYFAQERLYELGGHGSLDKEVKKRLKYGLQRLEFLLNEMKTSDLQGRKDKSYLTKLIKDVLQDVPLFTDPEMQGKNFVKEVEIVVDRESEVMEIVHLLLSDDSDSCYNSGPVSVVLVRGIAGADKTDFTRHVYYHQSVQKHFDARLRVDFNGVHSVSEMLNHVAIKVGSSLDEQHCNDDLVHELQRVFKDKKYLIVLEDLSNEDDGKGVDLLEPLLSAFANCKPGSKLLVTSTSISVEPHMLVRPHILTLEPLDQNASLALFQKIAFKGIAEVSINPRLIDIGLEIVNKCDNNLHAIKFIASIISSEPANVEKWQYLSTILLTTQGNPLSYIRSAADLMQSTYDSLKYCPNPLLTYSTLFPLDYKFSMVELQQLWEVQGFLDEVPEVGLETFYGSWLDLIKGYFLRNTERDKNGVTICYNTQPLMHEVVKHMASDDYRLLDKPTEEVDAQHVSFIVNSSWEAPSWLYDAKLLKSLVFLPSESCSFITIRNINDMLADLKSLQALDLAIVNCGRCPDFIGKLKHLRYLRLGISFESLPECITNLKYLSTLDLRHTTIQELPESFHRLCSLRHLYTGGRLIDLPPRFEKLTQLQTLDVFIVGRNNGLGALANLLNLAGKLKICFKKSHEKVWPDYNTISADKSPNFLSDTNLDDLSIVWSSFNKKTSTDIEQEKDLIEFEILQPPETLKTLAVQGWKGASFPQWKLDDLWFIYIADCCRCQYLPSFSSLRWLKSLQLWGLDALEYIEICEYFTIEFFPSLKYLILVNLPQLRGWSKVKERDTDCEQEHEINLYVPPKFFYRLSELRVRNCPKFMLTPLVPSLVTLEAADIHQRLLKHLLNSQQLPSAWSDSSAPATLKELHICAVHELQSLSITTASLQVLTITECKELTNLLVESSNSLKRLKIRACLRLKDISRALQNLSILEELEIESCEELNWACMMDDIEKIDEDSLPAAKLGLNNLHSLTVTNISKPEPLPNSFSYLRTLKELSLCWLYNMSVLPESIGHLTQLCRLVIRYCFKLKRLPVSLPNLKTLKQLEIKGCPKLQKRCKQPDGEDCILIDHIPNVHLG